MYLLASTLVLEEVGLLVQMLSKCGKTTMTEPLILCACSGNLWSILTALILESAGNFYH